MATNCNGCGNPCSQCDSPVYSCPKCSDAPYTDVNCGFPTNDNCVNYTGDDDVCLNIIKPLSLKTIIAKMVLYFKGIYTRITSTSLNLTVSGGACNNALSIEIVPSSDPNNIFTLGQDGKPYVGEIIVSGHQCLDVTKTIVSGKIFYTLGFNLQCLSDLICPICSVTPGTNCPQPLNIQINSK